MTSPVTFALCPTCRRAWTAPSQPAPCCGVAPVVVSPFNGKRRVWFFAAIRGRLDEITEAAHYRTTAEHRESLARAAVARGRTMAVGR